MGDFHGYAPSGIKKFIIKNNIESIISPGDFCSDARIREPIAIRYKEFLKNPYTARQWWEIAGKKKAKEIVQNSLKEGRKILEQLDSFNIPVYVVPGNGDNWTTKGWNFLNRDFFNVNLIKDLRNIINVDEIIKDVGMYEMVGYGKCNGPELYKLRGYENIMKKKDMLKNEKEYGKLLEKYSILFEETKKKTIFLSHNVPFNTSLDKIVNKGSARDGYHYGSLLSREIIEQYQPLLYIGGHMHEHQGQTKIGRTIIVNPGYGREGKAAVIELNDGKPKIEKIRFVRIK